MTEELKNTPIEDFDWEAFEKGETPGEKSREELTKTYDESLNTVKDKDVIEGTIIALNKREAVVNIGYKSDGIIPMSEFRYNPEIKVLGNALTRPSKTTKSSRATSSAAPRVV